jgi:hypothetical protein
MHACDFQKKRKTTMIHLVREFWILKNGLRGRSIEAGIFKFDTIVSEFMTFSHWLASFLAKEEQL